MKARTGMASARVPSYLLEDTKDEEMPDQNQASLGASSGTATASLAAPSAAPSAAPAAAPTTSVAPMLLPQGPAHHGPSASGD